MKSVKINPSGYSISQGGTYGVVGFDPLNYKVSSISSNNSSGTPLSGGNGGLYRAGSGLLRGGGLGAEVIGSMAGVVGGVAGAWLSGANPYIVAGSTTAVGGIAKSLAEMIGLGHMKGGGLIPQKYIDFVDRLISNKKTLSQIKNAIMNFELSSELKAKLSKAVSSLLNKGGGGQRGSGIVRSKLTRASGVTSSAKGGRSPKGRKHESREGTKTKQMERSRTNRVNLSGSGGIFQPNVSAYGLAKF